MSKPTIAETRRAETLTSRIVAKSLSINERAACPDIFDQIPDPWEATHAGKTLENWREALNVSGPTFFERRLQKSGFTQEAAAGFLSTPKAVAVPHWPFWAHNLQDMLADLSPGSGRWHCDIHPRDRDLAFIQIIEPLAQWVDQKLSVTYGQLHQDLSSSALAGFDRQLRADLSALCAPTLVAEFQIARFRLSRGRASLPGSTFAYDQFVNEMYAAGCVPLFEKYPVLARFLAVLVTHWQSFLSEFATRLQHDRPALSHTLGWASETLVDAVKLGLSDKHANGRSCIKLVFGEGRSVFYKPKSLAPDLIYETALNNLTSHMDVDPIHMLRTMDRGAYGWVEGVTFAPCETPQEVASFYRNAGIVLFVQYLYGGSDLHYENLIACGPGPVVVDHECLMSHLPLCGDTAAEAGAQSASDYFLNSVMRVHFLPAWRVVNGDRVSDSTAFGCPDDAVTGHFQNIVRFPNTDLMRLERVMMPGATPKCAPRLNGAPVNPIAFLQDVLSGFQSAYRAYLKAGPENDPVLDTISTTTFRYIFRDTKSYFSLLKQLCMPTNLRSGVEAQIAIEGLWRAPMSEPDMTSDLSKLVDAEIAQILNLDAPLFHTHPQTCTLTGPKGMGKDWQRPNYFAIKSEEVLKQRIARLDDVDEAVQCSHIRASFTTRFPHTPDLPRSSNDGSGNALHVATEIAEILLDSAIVNRDGSCSWNGISTSANGAWQSGPLPLCFYDGLSGIAVFLAGMARVTGNTRYERAAITALDKIIGESHFNQNRQTLTDVGYGIAKGYGSVIYSLLTVSKILEKPDLVQHAERYGRSIDLEQLLAGDDVDLLGGSAGCLLAFASLHKVQPHDDWKAIIRHCADHIMSRAQRTGDTAFWSSPHNPQGNPARTGFAHGAGGIGYALFIAGDMLAEPTYAATRRKALAFDNAVLQTLFRPETSLHGPDCTWCNGVPAIVAAKLALTQAGHPLDGAERDLLSRAVTHIAQHSPSRLDHFCCGTAGRINLLSIAARLQLSDTAKKAASDNLVELISQWTQNGSFRMGWGAYTAIPTFHQGLAGIGYTLLQSSTSDPLPQVALFQ